MSNLNAIKNSYASYESYIEEKYSKTIANLNNNAQNMSAEDTQLLGYLQNNLVVVNNILQNYQPSDSMTALTKVVTENIDVYIILENWCGSSAANVPYIVKILQTLKSVNIHIVPRDSNPEFMDLYLSEGKRSIPKVIGFSGEKEIFNWGSATKMQAVYAASLKEKNLPMPAFIQEMQAWFKIHNAEAIEQDFLIIFNNLTTN